MTDENGKMKGFSIELFDNVASLLNIEYSIEMTDVKNKLLLVEKGEKHLAIGAISITETRLKKMDFVPVLETGYGIMVRNEGCLLPTFSERTKTEMIIFGLLLVCLSIMYYFAERGGAVPKNLWLGLWHSIYGTIQIANTTGQGDKAPTREAGRVVFFLGMLTILPLFALTAGDVVSDMVVTKSSATIIDHYALRGKTVAVKKNTSSEEFLQNIGAKIIQVDEIEQAYNLLIDRKVYAVFYDELPLLHKSKQDNRVITTGMTVGKHFYGYAFPKGSPLAKDFEIALAHFRESGDFQNLYNKWFDGL